MDAARFQRATDNSAIFEARLMIRSRGLRGPFVSRIISAEKCEKIISGAAADMRVSTPSTAVDLVVLEVE